jgi:2-dehydropantoate 2-reductase
MRIIVYGAGGIGCVIGGHLFRQGFQVVLVGNPQHMDAIKANGLRLVTGDGTFVLHIPVAKTANELVPFRDDDVVLLSAMSQHTLRCLGQLRNAGAPVTLPIFCCQNSIWNESMALRIFDNVYGVMVSLDAIFLTPGEVINPTTVSYGFLEVGRYPRGTDKLCEQIVRALQRAGFQAAVHSDVMKSKTAKCLINLSNALFAITDGKGDVRSFTDEVCREATQVWSSAGIEWEDQESFRRRCEENSGTEKIPATHEHLSRAAHVSSWQSLTRATGSIEAEQLNGDVVALGRMLGVRTPYNELLWRVADEMARHHEMPGKYSTDELLSMIREQSK